MPKLLDASTENRFFSIMQNSDHDNKEEDLIGVLTLIILLISIENNSLMRYYWTLKDFVNKTEIQTC